MKETRVFLIPNLDKAVSAGYTSQNVNKMISLGFRCFSDD